MEDPTQKDKKVAMGVMTKKMSNYFSIGIDARIGLGLFYKKNEFLFNLNY